MPLWRRLYGTIWLAFFCCVLIPRWIGLSVGPTVHGLLGALMVVLTQWNLRTLRTLPVPARLTRISKVMAGLAIVQLVLGVALSITMVNEASAISPVVRGLHVVTALAILAQASSVATAYDMWEEKEFGDGPA